MPTRNSKWLYHVRVADTGRLNPGHWTAVATHRRDGLREAPASIDLRRQEARTDRRLPGEGELPIQDLLKRATKGIPLSVEAPTIRLRGLPFAEQAKFIGEVTRSFPKKPGTQAV